MRVAGFTLFLIAAALVVVGLLVVVTSQSGGAAPRWVHVLSALPFFIIGLLVVRLGLSLRRR
jgi:uncharacterized protein (DUF983 family)